LINRRIEQFQSGKFSLTGQWDEPADVASEEKSPGIIFCHGFTGNRFESRRMYARLSRSLALQGMRCFRFDHRGCGESEGDFREFDADGLLEDLNEALMVFLANNMVDPDRTAVVGYSLGGLSASYLLSKRPDFLTAVYWAPVAQPDIIRDRLATYPEFSGYNERGYFDYMGFRVGADYIDKIGALEPVQWAKPFGKSILFVQGSDDPIVKPEQVQIYLAERSNENDELIMIPDGDHAFGSADNIDLVLAASERWLLERFQQA